MIILSRVKYCLTCGKEVIPKRNAGLGFWLFVVFIWFPTFCGSIILLLVNGFLAGVLAHSSIGASNFFLISFVIILLWLLFPITIYYSKKPKCPICRGAVSESKPEVKRGRKPKKETENEEEPESDEMGGNDEKMKVLSQITELGKLRDSKFITDEEFELKKKKLLRKI